MSKILEIKNLNKDFGNLNILNNINVTIEEGDFLVLVGPSGCGKSTLLNCIAGLEPISGGSIAIDGRDMTNISPKDRDIAMVFQSYALYPTMTVGQNITFGMKVRGIEKNERGKKLLEVAKQLQIEPLLNRRPGQLSGGQRQRVAMGRALVRDPKLFLFAPFFLFVSCSLAAMSTRVDFDSGAAWSAMPSVATRPISVVDVCCRHTLHVSWQPAVVPSASICLPLRKVCLLLLVDVLL